MAQDAPLLSSITAAYGNTVSRLDIPRPSDGGPCPRCRSISIGNHRPPERLSGGGRRARCRREYARARKRFHHSYSSERASEHSGGAERVPFSAAAGACIGPCIGPHRKELRGADAGGGSLR